mmetsp:Transcript_118162/g.329525  ORF Transcript_118162/g.329525 Transcript_118162/m.329525 type:complete len:250 (+) Transcript_118162:379-1128(+)
MGLLLRCPAAPARGLARCAGVGGLRRVPRPHGPRILEPCSWRLQARTPGAAAGAGAFRAGIQPLFHRGCDCGRAVALSLDRGRSDPCRSAGPAPGAAHAPGWPRCQGRVAAAALARGAGSPGAARLRLEVWRARLAVALLRGAVLRGCRGLASLREDKAPTGNGIPCPKPLRRGSGALQRLPEHPGRQCPHGPLHCADLRRDRPVPRGIGTLREDLGRAWRGLLPVQLVDAVRRLRLHIGGPCTLPRGC